MRRPARLDAAYAAALEIRLQNPFRTAVRRAGRALVGARMLPPERAPLSAWQTWWRALPHVLRGDRAAALALFVGVGTGYPLEDAQARILQAATLIRGDVSASAELACRSLLVRARLERIVGHSAAMQRVRAGAWAAAFGDRLDHTLALGRLLRATPVLMLGETGTGKELVAQALCAASPGRWRQSEGWSPGHADAVNLASLPDDLVFSALFGHRRGAYTGAGVERVGVLEQCHEGVVFLDEVADLPPKAQVALLRCLQEGRVRPLGSDTDVDAAPRVISATHQNLTALAEAGGFRMDLYYRLGSVVLQLPPLRERLEDLHALAEALLRGVDPELRPLVHERFCTFAEGPGAGYHWPGNVRELAAVMHALALGLQPRLLARTERNLPPGIPPEIIDGTWSLDIAKRWYVRHVSEQFPTKTAASESLDIDRGTLRALLKDAP